MAEKIYDLIISDLHLGNCSANRINILDLLDSEFENLIVNGDIFDCRSLHKLTSLDFAILERLEYLQSKNKCVAIGGNNEIYVNTKKYTSLNFKKQYVWSRFGKKILAVHGHATNRLKFWMHLPERVTDFAQNNDFKVVFAGHNHSSAIKNINDIIYVNTGSCLGWVTTYAVITSEGNISLRYKVKSLKNKQTNERAYSY